MLPKTERLTKKDFTGLRPKVFFRGEFIDVGSSILHQGKYACVISKKTLKKATERNLVKRRVLNIIKSLQFPKTHSFVFYPKKVSYNATYNELSTEIKKAINYIQ